MSFQLDKLTHFSVLVLKHAADSELTHNTTNKDFDPKKNKLMHPAQNDEAQSKAAVKHAPKDPSGKSPDRHA